MRDIFVALHGVVSISVYAFCVMLIHVMLFMYGGLLMMHSSLGYC